MVDKATTQEDRVMVDKATTQGDRVMVDKATIQGGKVVVVRDIILGIKMMGAAAITQEDKEEGVTPREYLGPGLDSTRTS